jgi:hypothetical protein
MTTVFVVIIASGLISVVGWLWITLIRSGVIGFGESIFDALLMRTRIGRGEDTLSVEVSQERSAKLQLRHSQVYANAEVSQESQSGLETKQGK